jgi:hypothetical protein
LWRPFLAIHQGAIRHTHGRLQPSVDVQQHPCAIRVMTHGPHQKFPLDFIKGSYDTLPIIRTFPSKLQSSALGIRLKVNL